MLSLGYDNPTQELSAASETTSKTHSPRSPHDEVNDSVSSSSSQEYHWDITPSQYELQSMSVVPTIPPPPLMSLQIQPPPILLFQASTPVNSVRRPRTYATTGRAIRRSKAFRSPTPDCAFLTTPSPTLSPESQDRLPPRRSRIPRPKSPSTMDLHRVNDIAELPLPGNMDPPFRRSSRNAARTLFPPPGTNNQLRRPDTYIEEKTSRRKTKKK